MIRQMGVEELKTVLDKDADAPLIDVREVSEFSEIRARRAKLVALSQFDPSILTDTMHIKKNQTVYLICRSGARSMRAAQLLEQSGFTDLVNIEGGTLAWVQCGFETDQG